MNPHKSNSEGGQILLLLAVGLVVLLGLVALAIDGGAIFLDRRSAQNAADAAALAGAYQLARDPWDTGTLTIRIVNESMARAHDNHFGNEDGKIVSVFYPPDATTIRFVAGDNNVDNYVRVTITSTVNTSFLHFVFNAPVVNTVEAVAHVTPPDFGNPFVGSGLVSLAPHDCGRLTIGGTTNANLIGGGIFVNSDNTSCAVDGGSGSAFVYTPSMTVVGGVGMNHPENVIVEPGPIDSPDAAAAVPYPPNIGIPPVPTCKDAAGNPINAYKSGKKTVNSIQYDDWYPGIMDGIPNGNVYFEPGIYCITFGRGGSGRSFSANNYYYNDPTDPLRILLVFTGYDPCSVNFNGGASIELKGYGAEPYKGLLFYFDPEGYTSIGSTLSLNGTEDSYINGTLFAPTCNVILNGNNGQFYQGQVIGYDVTLGGGGTINMLFVEADNFEEQKPAKVDLNQ